MRNRFIGYYSWTEEEFSQLWENALFVFDTNTLLNIYRYQDSTCRMFLETLEAIQDKIWIPYQVGLEFHRNRRTCIKGQTKAYKVLEDTLEQFSNEFDEVLRRYKLHKFIRRDELNKEFESALKPISKTIKSFKEIHPNYGKSDTVLKRITDIFDSRVGEEMEDGKLERIYCEGKDRYSRKIPPGYMDGKKGKDDQVYGDLVIWEEMIIKAKCDECSVIFVTSDEKEDWWLLDGRKTIGPRPELLQEFKERSGQRCYIYGPSIFISKAREIFNIGDTDEDAISEIKEVRSNSEMMFSTREVSKAIARSLKESCDLASSEETNLYGDGLYKFLDRSDVNADQEDYGWSLDSNYAQVQQRMDFLGKQLAEVNADIKDSRTQILESQQRLNMDKRLKEAVTKYNQRELNRLQKRRDKLKREYVNLKNLIHNGNADIVPLFRYLEANRKNK